MGSATVQAHVETCEARVRRDLARNDLDGLRAWLAGQRAPDIADVLDRLPEPDQARVFALLSPAEAAEVLDEAGTETTRVLLARLPAATAAGLLDRLPMDEVAELLTQDVPDRQDELLGAMSPADAAEVRDLLAYPPHSAGRLMTEQFVRVRPAMTAAETLAFLRGVDPAAAETLTNLYVMDEADRLVGVVSLREVVTAPPERRLGEMMSADVIGVAPDADQEEVAALVARYDFLGLPVVTAEGRMLGVITVDDVIDVLVEEGTEDVLRFGGIEGGAVLDQPYFTVPLWRVVRKRVGWLLLLFVAETFTGSVLRIFQDELARVVALAFFIPLLIGTGGQHRRPDRLDPDPWVGPEGDPRA